MGYVHDTSMAVIYGPSDGHYVTGTWTDAAGAVAGSIVKAKAAADNTGVVSVLIRAPFQSSGAQKGAYLKTIDVWWNVTTAALDAMSAAINRIVLPANGDAMPAVVAHAFSYDTGHDTAAERLTLAKHKMTLTLTTPIWLDDDDKVVLELTFDAAATSVVHFHCARANFTLRI